LLWLVSAALHGDCSDVNALSSEITIRTYQHRPTIKRELVFRRNHCRRAPLIHCRSNKGTLKCRIQTRTPRIRISRAQQQKGKEQIDAADALTSSFPGGFQAIATAYGDYTKKSFEYTKSFVEKLSGVKSFDQAVQIQTEFAKSAFETFVAESQKIGAMYGDLAKQSCKPFGGFSAKMVSTNR
jgi:hypothetical protein